MSRSTPDNWENPESDPLNFMPVVLTDADGQASLVVNIYAEGEGSEFNYVTIQNDTTTESICCDYEKIDLLIKALEKAKEGIRYIVEEVE